MKIDLIQIPVKEIFNGYKDNPETGEVVGFGGKLNIRPAYQREFVYNNEQQQAVLKSVYQGFPLNVMYWVKNDDGTFEVLDGQQRTISFCQYVNGDFSVDNKYFHNLTNVEKEQILKYKELEYMLKQFKNIQIDELIEFVLKYMSNKNTTL